MAAVRVVIMVAEKDFGRCALASQTHRALWPLAGKPVLQRLIDSLATEGFVVASLYCESCESLIRDSISLPDGFSLDISEDHLYRGTGGCLRHCANAHPNDTLILLDGCCLNPPSVGSILRAHEDLGGDLTLFVEPEKTPCAAEDLAPVVACRAECLTGPMASNYCDIKESLVPEFVRAGRVVKTFRLSEPVLRFRDWRQYRLAVAAWLEQRANDGGYMPGFCNNGRSAIWIGQGAEVHPSARLIPPVVVGEGACIAEQALIAGPGIIDRNAKIGRGSTIVESVVWPDTWIGPDCMIEDAVIDRGAVVRNGEAVCNRAVSVIHTTVRNLSRKALRMVEHESARITGELHSRAKPPVSPTDQTTVGTVFRSRIAWVAAAALAVLYLWAYWKPTLINLWDIWMRSDEYSSGLLVPILAVYVLWGRRKSLADTQLRPSLLAGLGLFVCAQAFRLFGMFYMFASVERISLVLTVIALVLMICGWRFVWRISGVLLFLFLMIPFPNRVQASIAQPLQDWSTSSAVFGLEMLGYEVVRQGNVIDIAGTQVFVAEACNGLRMLTAFIVISGLIALVVERKWWEKLIILLSSIPIALVCNTLRLIVTAIAFTKLNTERWEQIFHDFGGYAMMPVAVAIIVFELWLLSNLFIENKKVQSQVVYRRRDACREGL